MPLKVYSVTLTFGHADRMPPDADINDVWPDELDQAIAVTAWRAARAHRSNQYHHRAACPTRNAPYGPEDLFATQVAQACRDNGCLDLHHELVPSIRQKYQQASCGEPTKKIENVSAYLKKIAENELVEHQRRQRTGQSLAARPSRSDGAPSHVNEDLMECGGPEASWLMTVFQVLRVYATQPNRCGENWPLDWLAYDREQLGLPPKTSAELHRDIRFVLDRAKALLGPGWVYDNILGPLGAGMPTKHLDHDPCGRHADLADVVLGDSLVKAFRGYRSQGLGLKDAALRAISEVCRLELHQLTASQRAAFRNVDLAT